ncbi:hypothetical protein M3Y94_00908800 [Aphelenchoides besseyi]|nr:hypothetical protein M3Y94_00906000 [Aphelenchoides besseyi]KAI6206422.1 hypothetical protein M3Y94_00908800 [Aphelenchoides besseyi]KAI6223289.1 hypothetical protein M3Y95_00873900 [Aphelenchoides besseyi]
MDVQFLSMLGLMLLVFVTPLVIECKSKKKPKGQKKTSKQSGKSNLLPVSSGKNTKSKSGKPEGSGKTVDDQPKTKDAVVVGVANAKNQAGPFDEEYPEVVEPTPSVKKKREKQLEESRKLKIKKGFYQSKSDEDDTLEKIKSLKEEKSDDELNQTSKKMSKKMSKKSKTKSKAKNRKAQ